MPINLSRVGVRRIGPSSFQWCPVTGQGLTGTNWSIGSSTWRWGRTSSLWGWGSPGTGCPGRWWILLLWRYSRPTWTRSCGTCCRWPCFSRGVGLDDPQRFLPTPNILWFCDVLEYTRLLPLSGNESIILFEITFDVRYHFSHTNHIQHCSHSFWVNEWTCLFVPHHPCFGAFEHSIYTCSLHVYVIKNWSLNSGGRQGLL